MIRLSGRREDDIPIVFTGARAGEKVHEVLWNEGEAVGPTSHPKIMRAARPQIDAAWLEEALAELERLVDEGDTLGVVAQLGSMVAEPQRTGARRFSKTRCTDVTAARRERGYGGAVDPLDGLNPEQRRAAEAVRGPVCILAGAGSGKTTTITRRIAQQVATGAFAAAADHGGHVHRQGGRRAEGRGSPALGVQRRPRLDVPLAPRCGSCAISRPDEVGRILPSKALALRQIANAPARRVQVPCRPATSRPRSSGRRTAASGRTTTASAAADREPPIPLDLMHRVYRDYERRKAAEGLLDFEDLLERTVQLFERDDAARARRSAPSTARSPSTSTRTSTCCSRRCSTSGSATATTSASSATTTSRSTRSPVPARSTCSACRDRFPHAHGRAARGELPLDAAGARAREPARAEARRRREGAARRARRTGPSPSCGPFASPEAEGAAIVERIRVARLRRSRRSRSSRARTRG